MPPSSCSPSRDTTHQAWPKSDCGPACPAAHRAISSAPRPSSTGRSSSAVSTRSHRRPGRPRTHALRDPRARGDPRRRRLRLLRLPVGAPQFRPADRAGGAERSASAARHDAAPLRRPGSARGHCGGAGTRSRSVGGGGAAAPQHHLPLLVSGGPRGHGRGRRWCGHLVRRCARAAQAACRRPGYSRPPRTVRRSGRLTFLWTRHHDQRRQPAGRPSRAACHRAGIARGRRGRPRGRRGKRRASCASCSRDASGSTWCIPSPSRPGGSGARPAVHGAARALHARAGGQRRIDREGKIPREVIDGLASLGAFGIKIPEEYGGLGLSQTSYTHAIGMVTSQDGNLTALLSAASRSACRSRSSSSARRSRRRSISPAWPRAPSPRSRSPSRTSARIPPP